MLDKIEHSTSFRRRRFLNWFPMGLTYALLYMGRYNLTVAKNALGDLLTKEDFGLIFGAGTAVYAFSFLLNGPLVDRMGGRKGMLLATAGTAIANAALAAYLFWLLSSGGGGHHIVAVFSVIYSINMYFQSFGAVSIVKVNAHWFHLRERGGFSGIFGTMIASGIFLAFTVNGWMLDFAAATWPAERLQWVVFAAPAALLAVFTAVEFVLLRDRPSHAGLADFDTGDASSGDADDKPLPTREVFRRLLTNPIILTVAAIEFCTGVVRQGVMHWFPIYATEVWALPRDHALKDGSWEHLWVVGVCFGAAAVSWILAGRTRAKSRGVLVVLGALAFIAPFLQAGWGGILFVAGVIGSNVAGWISDLFFQSRRGPTAAGLYALMILCAVAMIFALAQPSNVVATAKAESGLLPGDKIVSLAGEKIDGWADVRLAAKCFAPNCVGSAWNPEACVCATDAPDTGSKTAASQGTIPATVERGGALLETEIVDPLPSQRAGEMRKLQASPVLPLSPYWLGVAVFLLSLGVIGTHGLLSGTLTMDFGGRKAAATAVGLVDGCVYLGTALQSICLGYLTTENWSYWPLFLLPFTVVGFLLLLRIWKVVPSKGGH